MSNIPSDRLTVNKKPFSNSGVDYFGSVLIKSSRCIRLNPASAKRYRGVTYPEEFPYWYTGVDFHIGIPAWAPKFWHPKMKYAFIFTIILHHRLCFFLLNLSKVYF